LRKQGFDEEQSNDAVYLINAVEADYKGTGNLLFQNVKLLMLKKGPEESVEYFDEKIKKKAQLCELQNVRDPSDNFPLLGFIAGLRETYAHQVDTFAKVVEMCLEERNAAKTSRQYVSGSSGDVAATSTYNKDQRAGQTAAQRQFLEVVAIIMEAVMVVQEGIVVVMEAKSKREANLMSLGRLTSGSNANT
jgi:hypothetical protein